jgi:two-component system response regulator YesN
MDRELLKVIVVDDEVMIREGLSLGIPWKDWGYEIVGTGKNGAEAIELIKEYSPDVVITDIRMPKMNGIELIKYIEKEEIQCQVIIISGYTDIEYYKKAIEHNVFDYLLKPTEDMEVKRVFERLKQKLENDKEQLRHIEEMKAMLDESIPLMKRNFLTRLLDGELMDWEIIRQKLYFFNFYLQLNKYCVVRVAFESLELNQNQDIFFEEHQCAMEQYIVGELNRRFSKFMACVFFMNNRGEIVGICETDDILKVQRMMNEYANNLLEKKDIYLMVGISNPSVNIEEISGKQDQANQALLHLVMEEDTNIQCFSNLKVDSNTYLNRELNVKAVINKFLASKPNDEVEELESFFHFYTTEVQPDIEYIDTMCYVLYSEFVGVGIRYGIIRENDYCHNFKANLDALTRLNSKKELLYQSMSRVKEKIDLKKSKKETIIIEIEGFIMQHLYDTRLSLTMIGDGLNRNPAYLSSIYKKHTGNNILDYITDHRIEQAKKFLKTTSMKSYEIAEKIGYGDASYFTKIFKKHQGLSPSEYRK